jgi:23S rRNA pseudouridine2605 synthase
MIRLQKLLAGAGLGSRRTVEEWIRAGRITVAGTVAKLGDRAAPGDDVRLDGRKLDLSLASADSRQVLLYYKPVGEVTTRSDPEGRPTVFERLPNLTAGRWINVGRLDVNTSGLLLLTTDGDLAHRLMHPSSEVEREYLVRLRGRPGPEVIRLLLKGIPLEDGLARFDRISTETAEGTAEPEDAASTHSTFRVVLHEGRNREVRRLWNAAGFEVSRLLRIRYGPVELPRDMRPGTSRALSAELLGRLEQAARGPGSKTPGPALNKGVPSAPGSRPPGGSRRRHPAGGQGRRRPSK